LDKNIKKDLLAKYIPGSKVPSSFLFDYIKEGYSITEFLSAYPWLEKEKVENTLEKMKKDFSSSYAF